MTVDGDRAADGDALGRRRFLALAGATSAAALAGCSGVTTQSFEASPVVLPDADQTEIRLAETARDSRTFERSGPADSEVEITNHVAVYSRADALGGL